MTINNDNFDDLVFQHKTTGGVYAWELNAKGFLAGGDLGVPGSTWVAADASSDYNADGLDDIFFQNTTNGEDLQQRIRDLTGVSRRLDALSGAGIPGPVNDPHANRRAT